MKQSLALSHFKKQQLWSKFNVLDARGETHTLTIEKKLEQIN